MEPLLCLLIVFINCSRSWSHVWDILILTGLRLFQKESKIANGVVLINLPGIIQLRKCEFRNFGCGPQSPSYLHVIVGVCTCMCVCSYICAHICTHTHTRQTQICFKKHLLSLKCHSDMKECVVQILSWQQVLIGGRQKRKCKRTNPASRGAVRRVGKPVYIRIVGVSDDSPSYCMKIWAIKLCVNWPALLGSRRAWESEELARAHVICMYSDQWWDFLGKLGTLSPMHLTLRVEQDLTRDWLTGRAFNPSTTLPLLSSLFSYHTYRRRYSSSWHSNRNWHLVHF